MDGSDLTFAEREQLKLDRERQDRIEKRNWKPVSTSLKEAALTPFEGAYELSGGSDPVTQVTGAAAGFVGGVALGAGFLAARGVSAAWARRPAKLPTFSEPLRCVECKSDHQAVLFEGNACDAVTGHVIKRIKCPVCPKNHNIPSGLGTKTTLKCPDPTPRPDKRLGATAYVASVGFFGNGVVLV
jgi:hypothetical protein